MVQIRPPHAGINIGKVTDAAKVEGDLLEILMVGCDRFERCGDPSNSRVFPPKHDPLEFHRCGEVNLTGRYFVCRLRGHDKLVGPAKRSRAF